MGGWATPTPLVQSVSPVRVGVGGSRRSRGGGNTIRVETVESSPVAPKWRDETGPRVRRFDTSLTNVVFVFTFSSNALDGLFAAMVDKPTGIPYIIVIYFGCIFAFLAFLGPLWSSSLLERRLLGLVPSGGPQPLLHSCSVTLWTRGVCAASVRTPPLRLSVVLAA